METIVRGLLIFIYVIAVVALSILLKFYFITEEIYFIAVIAVMILYLLFAYILDVIFNRYI